MRTVLACRLLELSADALANMQRDAPELVTKFHQFVTANIAQRMQSEASMTDDRPRPRWLLPAGAVAVLAAGGTIAAVALSHRTPAASPPAMRRRCRRRSSMPASSTHDAPPPPPVDAAARPRHDDMVELPAARSLVGRAGMKSPYLARGEVKLAPYLIDKHEMTRGELEKALGDKSALRSPRR